MEMARTEDRNGAFLALLVVYLLRLFQNHLSLPATRALTDSWMQWSWWLSIWMFQKLLCISQRIVQLQVTCCPHNWSWTWCKPQVLTSSACILLVLYSGGFLAQHFAAKYPTRVRSCSVLLLWWMLKAQHVSRSLVLCNSFASTYAFESRAGTCRSR